MGPPFFVYGQFGSPVEGACSTWNIPSAGPRRRSRWTGRSCSTWIIRPWVGRSPPQRGPRLRVHAYDLTLQHRPARVTARGKRRLPTPAPANVRTSGGMFHVEHSRPARTRTACHPWPPTCSTWNLRATAGGPGSAGDRRSGCSTWNIVPTVTSPISVQRTPARPKRSRTAAWCRAIQHGVDNYRADRCSRPRPDRQRCQQTCLRALWGWIRPQSARGSQQARPTVETMWTSGRNRCSTWNTQIVSLGAI